MSAPESTADLRRLVALPRPDRRGALQRLIAEEVRTSLLMTADEYVPVDVSVFELGLGSLSAVEVKERIEARLGCAIGSPEIYNHPTVAALAEFLESRVVEGRR
nr:acyl carrier protein [Catenulispora sp.]